MIPPRGDTLLSLRRTKLAGSNPRNTCPPEESPAMNRAPQAVSEYHGPAEAPRLSRAKVIVYDGEGRQVERTARRLFGRALEPWEYAGLAGAPDDALVEVGTLHGGIYLELCQPLSNSYRGSHVAQRLSVGVVLFNEGFHIHRRSLQRRGFGLRVVYRQFHAAKSLGVLRIVAMGGRSDEENGYYTWPRFGFDGPLPAQIRQRLPLGLRRARTALDLIDCEAGRRWWRQNGVPLHVSFDLADGSRSWAVFERYLRQAGRKAESGKRNAES